MILRSDKILMPGAIPNLRFSNARYNWRIGNWNIDSRKLRDNFERVRVLLWKKTIIKRTSPYFHPNCLRMLGKIVSDVVIV